MNGTENETGVGAAEVTVGFEQGSREQGAGNPGSGLTCFTGPGCTPI